jgi:hypothetical protein
MSRRVFDIRVRSHLADTPSEQGDQDEALVRELFERIKAIAQEDKYRGIVLPGDPELIEEPFV